MSPKPTLSVDDVTRFLHARFAASADDVRPLAGGHWSSAFAFEVGADPLVVRFGTEVGEYGKDAVAAGWGLAGVPIPEVLILDRWTLDAAASPGEWCVTRRADGVGLDVLDADGWRAALGAVLEVIVALAGVRSPAAGSDGGFGRWDLDGSMPESTWAAALAAHADGRASPRVGDPRAALDAAGRRSVWEEAGERLRVLASDAPDVVGVAHADLTAGNLLVANGRITALFDWANSIVGDPLYDVANLTLWQPWHPGSVGLDLLGEARRVWRSHGLGADDFDARVRRCEQAIGVDSLGFLAHVGDWATFDAVAARLRSR